MVLSSKEDRSSVERTVQETVRYHRVRIIPRVQSYLIVRERAAVKTVPAAFTVLAGCQQSAELPSLEMLDIGELNG